MSLVKHDALMICQDISLDFGSGPDSTEKQWGRLLSLTPTLCQSIDLSGEQAIFLGREHQRSLASVRQVSGNHCKIFLKDRDVVMVEDLSTNGTFIDRTRIGKGNALVLPNGAELNLTNPDHTGVPRCYFVFKRIGDGKDPREIAFQAKYILGEELARGAFASVWRGRDLAGNRYAIRKLDKKKMERGTSASGRSALQDEVRILETLKELRHPNVISVIEVCDTDQYIYMVMELAGRELFDEIRRHEHFPEHKARNYFRQLLSAVDYLHTTLKLVYSELKPENILLAIDDPDTIKIDDLTFSDSGALEKAFILSDDTALCIAPEVFSDSAPQYSTRAENCWSLGVILSLMLCGRLPFSRSSSPIQFDFDCEALRQVSPAAQDLVRLFLQRDPAKRLTAAEGLQHPWITGAPAPCFLHTSPVEPSTAHSSASSSSSSCSSSNSLSATLEFNEKTAVNEENQWASKSPTAICEHGLKCYRQNPVHFEERAHPWWTEEEISARIGKGSSSQKTAPAKGECKWGKLCHAHEKDHFSKFQHPWWSDADIAAKLHE